MKLYYKTRNAARTGAKALSTTATDCGTTAPAGKRWAVDLKKRAAEKLVVAS